MGHVLVVDDDECYLMILGRLCMSAGHHVITADNADDARVALANHVFDLMLLDLQMPRHEGLPLIAEVEADPHLARNAVVVTGFPIVATMFTKLPVIDKGKLSDLSLLLKKLEPMQAQ